MRQDWSYAPLGKACHIKPPKSEARERLEQSDPVSFVPMNDLGVREKYLSPVEKKLFGKVSGSYTYFAERDVLLAKITPCFENGKLGIAQGLVNGIGFGSSEFIVFRPNAELTPEFLFYFLSQDSFRDAGQRVMSGAVGHKRVPKEFIENHLIPLPPLTEQKSIVAILDEAFAGIDTAIANTQKNLANARELFESFLDSIFGAEGKTVNPVSLGDHIHLLTGFAFKSKGYTENPKSVPLLRGDNIVQDSLRWEKVKRWPENDVKTYEKYLLNEDDVVLAMDRTWVKNGIKFAKIGKSDLPCLLVQRVARLRAKESLNPSFLRFLIGSKRFERYVLSIQTGLGVPHISGKQIENFQFHLPLKEDQNQIVAKMNELKLSVGNLESNYAQKLSDLSEFKQSLLQQAMSGKLTAESSEQAVA
jgi:type I restriction enzyme S subunit